MSIEDIRNIFVIIGVIAGVLTAYKTFIEYRKNLAQRRAEHFVTFSKRLEQNEHYVEMLEMAERKDATIAEKYTAGQRRELLGLFEEIALLLNSDLIREPVAHYMFGYYAIDCWECEAMWKDLGQARAHWDLLRDFVKRMKDYGADSQYSRAAFRL